MPDGDQILAHRLDQHGRRGGDAASEIGLDDTAVKGHVERPAGVEAHEQEVAVDTAGGDDVVVRLNGDRRRGGRIADVEIGCRCH